MRRRTVLASLGGLVSSVVLVSGSGAFTSVEANRSVSVTTAGDNEALLDLEQLGDGTRSLETDSPETVEFHFPSLDLQADDPDVGLGVDSVYEFDRDNREGDSDASAGLLRISNEGTQPVAVSSQDTDDTDIEIELYDVTDPERRALRDVQPVLDVGSAIDVGFRIKTFGAAIGTFEETVTIVADATET